jgi:hypothetical protein
MKLSHTNLLVISVLLLLFGLEFSIIDKVVLTKPTTIFIAERMNNKQYVASKNLQMTTGVQLDVKPYEFRIADTIGHCLTTGGIVLFISCFMIRKQ